MVSCKDVALYFLIRGRNNSFEEYDISHLKLQKLVYYAQAASISLRGEPLFPEKIINWKHGPVVVELYEQYKCYNNRPIVLEGEILASSSIPSYAKNLLDLVYDKYAQFSAWKLRNMTHEEAPWKNTREHDEITLESLENYFGSDVYYNFDLDQIEKAVNCDCSPP